MLYLNGKIIPTENAHLNINDRGFLLADGIFTTMKYSQHELVFRDEHWHRLNNDAKQLHLPPLPISKEEWLSICLNILSKNHLDSTDAILRTTYTRGNSNRGLDIASTLNPTLLIRCFPVPTTSKPNIRLCLTPYLRNEMSKISTCKTLAYAENILAKHYAQREGFDDGILCNTKGQIVCSSSANIFLVKDNELYTPSIDSGALPGIMRQHVLNQATKHYANCHETIITPEMLTDAESLFITNCVIGEVPASFPPVTLP